MMHRIFRHIDVRRFDYHHCIGALMKHARHFADMIFPSDGAYAICFAPLA